MYFVDLRKINKVANKCHIQMTPPCEEIIKQNELYISAVFLYFVGDWEHFI